MGSTYSQTRQYTEVGDHLQATAVLLQENQPAARQWIEAG